MDNFIMKEMKLDTWYSIGENETKIAVIKDWIYWDCLPEYQLTLSTDYDKFIKRKL